MDLNDYRKEIDSIDDQLIALFAQRMETAEKIAEYKKANGLRVIKETMPVSLRLVAGISSVQLRWGSLFGVVEAIDSAVRAA